MADVAELAIRAKSDQVKTANQRIEKTSKVSGGAQKAVRALGTAFAGLSAIQAGRMLRSSIRSTAQISEIADVAQISAERMQELTKAFSDMAGVSESITQGGLRRFARRLDLARQGTGAASDTLERMNISLNQGTEPALNNVIARLQDMAETQSITGAASQLFGEDAGPKMAAALDQGEDALRRQIRELREHGRVLDEETVAGARAANDELEALSDRLSTQFAQRVAENAESIEQVATALANVAEFGVKALGAITDFGKFLGEELASEIHGAAADDIPRLQEEIEEFEATLSRLQKTSRRGPGGPNEGQQRRMDELREEIELRKNLIERAREAQNQTEENTEEIKKATEAASELSAEVKTVGDELQNAVDARSMTLLKEGLEDIRDAAEPGRRELREFREQAELLDRAVSEGILGGAEAEGLKATLVDDLSDAATNVRTLRGEMDILDEAISRVSESASGMNMQLRNAANLQGADFQQAASSLGSISNISQESMQSLQALGAAFDNVGALMKNAGEDQFETWKRIAQAQAIVSTSLAVANALAAVPPPANLALAATIGALGAVEVATIEQQEFQSRRASGGSVQSGQNVLVGEQGPEVVTMGASGHVTPNHALGGANSNNITQVFQVGDGASSGEVDQRIRAAAPFIAQVAKQAVKAEAARGGEMSRAVGRRR